MHNTIEKLMSGDEQIVTHYSVAREMWREIMDKFPDAEPSELSKELTLKQLMFEHSCGGRWLGQEIMVVTGITQFYTTSYGFGENKEKAIRVYKAFLMSYCSIEVKGLAEDVAKSYYLNEE
ncbi:hypothetical protein VCSRO93_3648 [Vibrio cholerae]|uniref:hypothetical protein n=1 Tax=Vibrio cholerae TaxID=666 RepID=UPI000E0A97EC|nr:hypothetical protein [Vibrio cholerae]EGR2468627.1 hypothetical protein [Vibrio cholerae]ELJ8535014.1 hypothetical protein [Vibrio cholerae]GIB63769.1 hypothetical protein VCSRO93_3648 [Vibrio cholerae]HDZ9321939.1 hypothetical protein [Vibrio cholerae]HDZ9447853.1 hypothetical protein [Vibrio cholerae]